MEALSINIRLKDYFKLKIKTRRFDHDKKKSLFVFSDEAFSENSGQHIQYFVVKTHDDHFLITQINNSNKIQ